MTALAKDSPPIIDKAERYNWVKPGDTGRQCFISIDELFIDHTYQRHEASKKNTLSIARYFNWVAFGAIVVMERDDGNKYIVDGQQRYLAAKSRGDIKNLPCVLFKSTGPKHESEAFISLNINRKFVRAVDKYRVAVGAKMNPETQVDTWLKSVGFEIADHGSENGIDFPAKLLVTWKLDAEACKSAAIAQRKINNGQSLHGNIHCGLWYLIHNGLDVHEYIDKIVRMGGKSGILQSIKMHQIEMGSSASHRLCGLAILHLINHRNRKKVSIKKMDA